MIRSVLAALMLPSVACAGGLTVADATIPLAPPGAMAHAAYFTLTNEGGTDRELIGVAADGYAVVHLHRSEEKDGIATMSAVDLIRLAPGQSVTFAPGGLHVMLMRPEAALHAGDSVTLTLEFANGERLSVPATVMARDNGS